MLPHLDDTIVALSSAAGPGARAVVRLSGPQALPIARQVFTPAAPIEPDRRACHPGSIILPAAPAPLPGDLHFWPVPQTYTGQELVELHTISSPPLIELLIAALLDRGARAAGPGEFTLRAFLAGKLDLTKAEAVLGVIEASNRTELTQALAQLAGGVSQPLQTLRDDLLNLLADLEAGLDFVEEDITFVGRDDLLLRLGKGLAQLTNVQRQLHQRALSDRPFRAVLAGRPNAGKSSLFNALTGGAALVSPEQGTTRDYLLSRLEHAGVVIELVDTAGWQDATGAISAQAQALGRRQAEDADLVLLCVAADSVLTDVELALLAQTAPPILQVTTKSDLAPAAGGLAVSASAGTGLDPLRDALADLAQARGAPPLAPSLSRCHGHVSKCLERLRRAHKMVLFDEPAELLAVELRDALEELGAMAGAVYTEDLLDRIFSRFCIGK